VAQRLVKHINIRLLPRVRSDPGAQEKFAEQMRAGIPMVVVPVLSPVNLVLQGNAPAPIEDNVL
jgi:hypothetical protein